MGSGVGVGFGVGVGSAVGVVVGSGVGDAVGSGVGVGTGVGVGSGVAPGTAGEPVFCGFGVATNQSSAFSFVSTPFPPAPPGRRSRLDDAGGAGATVPSTKAFVASPQPTASTTDPPTTRNAIAPPVAAKPPVYVASPSPTNDPMLFAIRKRRPGSRTVDDDHVALRVTVDPLDVAYTISSPIRST